MADDIQIQWEGLTELIAFLDGFEDLLKANLKLGLTDHSLQVETGARALAHRYGGDLEESILAAAIAENNGMLIVSVGSNLAYAWKRHETPYRMGSKGDLHDGGITIKDYYISSRGERTRNKASWRGQMPGRKFLERAVVATEDDFWTMCEDALDQSLGGY